MLWAHEGPHLADRQQTFLGPWRYTVGSRLIVFLQPGEAPLDVLLGGAPDFGIGAVLAFASARFLLVFIYRPVTADSPAHNEGPMLPIRVALLSISYAPVLGAIAGGVSGLLLRWPIAFPAAMGIAVIYIAARIMITPQAVWHVLPSTVSG